MGIEEGEDVQEYKTINKVITEYSPNLRKFWLSRH
jgi:hypothetical protein